MWTQLLLDQLDREASRGGSSGANQHGAPGSRDAGRWTLGWRSPETPGARGHVHVCPLREAHTARILCPVHEQDAEAVTRPDA